MGTENTHVLYLETTKTTNLLAASNQYYSGVLEFHPVIYICLDFGFNTSQKNQIYFKLSFLLHANGHWPVPSHGCCRCGHNLHTHTQIFLNYKKHVFFKQKKISNNVKIS